MPDLELAIDGRSLTVTHPGRLIYPRDGLTKSDLVDYWRKVATVALPHLKDRPVSLKRYPGGIGGQGFFQKERPDGAPGWVGTATVPKEGGEVHHVVVDSAATLGWLVQIGTIELHVALSTTRALDRPDRLIFDLDPSVDGRFDWVVDGARRLRALLEEAGLTPFVMTTGSRGLHVVCPLDRSEGFDRVRAIAQAAARKLAEAVPDRFTVEQRKAARGERVFIDYLRNGYAQTTILPYSPRAKPGAPVAAPVAWSAIGRIGPRRYDVRSMTRRLARTEDPWAAMDRHAAPVDRLAKVLGL